MIDFSEWQSVLMITSRFNFFYCDGTGRSPRSEESEVRMFVFMSRHKPLLSDISSQLSENRPVLSSMKILTQKSYLHAYSEHELHARE